MDMLPGKVPPEVLRAILSLFKFSDERVLVGPGEGIDGAVVDFGNEVLVASTDPITGTERRIGFYAVHINANDVAVMGAEPRWFLSTVLLPEDSEEGLALRIAGEIEENAGKLGVAVIGGHTEVTPGLKRPIVVGTMLGVAPKEKFVSPERISPGDLIVVTKWVGLEGTSIIAEEKGEELREVMSEEELERAKKLIELISVVKEALASRDFASGMHDPTEGGLANGLHEMANAAKLGFRVFADRIPILPETRKICEFYNLNPLALISSGALLIALPRRNAGGLLQRLSGMGIPVSIIGEFTSEGERVIVERGRELPLERPKTDELWKVVA